MISTKFRKVFFVGCSLKIIVFLFLVVNPLTIGSTTQISPKISQKKSLGDMDYYISAGKKYQEPIQYIRDTYRQFIQHEIKTQNDLVISPPILPLLVQLLNYEKTPILLSLLYLIISCGLLYLCLNWFEKQNMSWKFAAIFSLIPHYFAFSIVLNTSFLFAFLFFLFFIAYNNYFNDKIGSIRPLYILTILMILTRTNGIIFFPLVILLHFKRNLKISTKKKLFVFIIFSILSLLIVPYAVIYFNKSMGYSFFNFTTHDYINGIIPLLPSFINIPLSFILLIIAKTAYFLGIRPSYNNLNDFWIIIRSLTGLLLFLPGVLYLIKYHKKYISHIILLILFSAPFYIGAINEGYLIPIIPILFYYSTLAYRDTSFYLKNRFLAQIR